MFWWLIYLTLIALHKIKWLFADMSCKSEASSEPGHTSKMDCFAKKVNDCKPLCPLL